MNTKFTEVFCTNLVRVGVNMKILTLLLFLLTMGGISAQIRDSTYINSNSKAVVKGKQILINNPESNLNKPGSLMLYDGFHWKRINQDTIPTIDHAYSHFSFSQFSDHIFVAGKQGLWEYDGKDWTKHFIDDTLQEKRVFHEIIELPDTSFVLSAFSQFVAYKSGTFTILEKTFHEVLQFKDGKFTTLKSRWTDKDTRVGMFHSFQKFKVQPNGNYSYYTPIETEIPDRGFELVTFYPSHQIFKKDTNPDLTLYGFHREYIYLNDYIYDAKGSLWFGVSYNQQNEFACLVEKRANGELFLYGENIGLPRKSGSDTRSLDLDDKENIWFSHTHRFFSPPSGSSNPLHSIFKLSSDRKILKEYIWEEVLDKSIWYNGGNTTREYKNVRYYDLIKYIEAEKSLLLCSNISMIKFFPYKETTRVEEKPITPIHLYPNPVNSSNIITIESSTFDNVGSQLIVVVRDVNGALIREEIISSVGNQLKMNTQNLLRGTYFVSVLSNNKTILQTKFIKE